MHADRSRRRYADNLARKRGSGREPVQLPKVRGGQSVKMRSGSSAQIQSDASAYPREDRPESGIEPIGGEPSV